jgi:predicted RNase H-like nuclease (RuvC/YqgF family)
MSFDWAAAGWVVFGAVTGILFERVNLRRFEREAKNHAHGLEATIRTLENQISRTADELSKYERTTPKLEQRITDMANDLSRYETGISEIEKAAGLPAVRLCPGCNAVEGTSHRSDCPLWLNYTE